MKPIGQIKRGNLFHIRKTSNFNAGQGQAKMNSPKTNEFVIPDSNFKNCEKAIEKGDYITFKKGGRMIYINNFKGHKTINSMNDNHECEIRNKPVSHQETSCSNEYKAQPVGLLRKKENLHNSSLKSNENIRYEKSPASITSDLNKSTEIRSFGHKIGNKLILDTRSINTNEYNEDIDAINVRNNRNSSRIPKNSSNNYQNYFIDNANNIIKSDYLYSKKYFILDSNQMNKQVNYNNANEMNKFLIKNPNSSNENQLLKINNPSNNVNRFPISLENFSEINQTLNKGKIILNNSNEKIFIKKIDEISPNKKNIIKIDNNKRNQGLLIPNSMNRDDVNEIQDHLNQTNVQDNNIRNSRPNPLKYLQNHNTKKENQRELNNEILHLQSIISNKQGLVNEAIKYLSYPIRKINIANSSTDNYFS